MIYAASYSDYFQFAKYKAKSISWITATGPSIDILEHESKRVQSIPKKPRIPSSTYINQLPPILSLPQALIVANDLSQIYNELCSHLTSSSIDYFSIESGGNLGGHVIPEAWHPVELRICNPNSIVIVDDPSILNLLVLQQSKSVVIKKDKLQTYPLFCDPKTLFFPISLHQNLALDYNSYKNWLNNSLIGSDTESISFDMHSSKSASSFLVLTNSALFLDIPKYILINHSPQLS